MTYRINPRSIKRDIYRVSLFTLIVSLAVTIFAATLVFTNTVHPLWLGSLSWSGLNLCIGFTLGKASSYAERFGECGPYMDKWHGSYHFVYWSQDVKKLFLVPLMAPSVISMTAIGISFLIN